MSLFRFLLFFQSAYALTFTYFDTPTFNDLQGWSISCYETSGNFVGTYNSLSYAGLGYLHQQRSSDALYKMFFGLPSHYALRISAQLYLISEQDFNFDQYIVKIYADDNLAFRFELPQDIVLHVEKIINFDYAVAHSSDSLLLEILLVTAYSQVTSLGIRDLKITFLECPSGCVKCSFGEVQGSCLQWYKLDFVLSNKDVWNFHNDGWFTEGGENNNIFSCNSQQNLYFIGLFDQDTKIKKSFILPPHYQIKVEVLFLLVQNDFRKNPSLIVQIDGDAIFEYDTPIDQSSPNLCSYIYLDFNVYSVSDGIFRILTDSQIHNNYNVSLELYTQQKSTIPGLWGIRDFKVFLKKCHQSCQYTCQGPFQTDCVDEQFQYNDFYSSFTATTLTDQEGWDALLPYRETSSCNSLEILGGYNLLQGEHKLEYFFYDLKNHSKLYLQVFLYQIDQYSNSVFNIFLNGDSIFNFANTAKPLPMCGLSGFNDAKTNITISGIDHSQSFATLTFTTNQPADSIGYWGIRGVTLKSEPQYFNFKLVNEGSVNNLAGWQYASKTFQFSTCQFGNFDLYGFFQQNHAIKQYFKNIPNHYQINISLKIVLSYSQINSATNTIFLYVDNNKVWNASFGFTQPINACNNLNYSQILQFEFSFPHSDPKAFFEFNSTFVDYNSWGFRDFTFQYI